MTPRHPQRIPFFGSTSLLGNSDIHKGRIYNLSDSGCLIGSTPPLHQGDYFMLRIQGSANERPIDIDLAIVRWVKPHNCGLEFIRIQPQAQHLLQLAVQRHRLRVLEQNLSS